MADYTIDGKALKVVYGVTVTHSTGFLDIPKRKGETAQSWPDSDGEEPFTDAADIYFEARDLTLTCVLDANPKSDFLVKYAALRAALQAPGLRELTNPHTGTTHAVYLVDGTSFDLLTRWNPGRNAGQFTLKLREPAPARN